MSGPPSSPLTSYLQQGLADIRQLQGIVSDDEIKRKATELLEEVRQKRRQNLNLKIEGRDPVLLQHGSTGAPPASATLRDPPAIGRTRALGTRALAWK